MLIWKNQDKKKIVGSYLNTETEMRERLTT